VVRPFLRGLICTHDGVMRIAFAMSGVMVGLPAYPPPSQYAHRRLDRAKQSSAAGPSHEHFGRDCRRCEIRPRPVRTLVGGDNSLIRATGAVFTSRCIR